MTKRSCIFFLLVFAASIAYAGPDLKNILITTAFEAEWESMDISKTSGENYSGVILETESGLLSISRFQSTGNAAAHLGQANGIPSTFQHHPSKNVQLNNITYSITWQSDADLYTVASADNAEQIASIFYRGLDKAGLIAPLATVNKTTTELPSAVDKAPSRNAAITVLEVNGRTIKITIYCRGLATELLLHGQIRSLDTGKVLQVVPTLLPPTAKPLWNL